FDALREACEQGFTNIILDDDGYVRRFYTYIDDGEKVYKSFAVKVAEKITGEDYTKILPETAEIQYTSKPDEFTTVSMADVLDKTIPASYFANSIVLIGAHEEGMLDSYKVPVDRANQMYGVECQANAINAILDNKLIASLPLLAEAVIAATITAVFSLAARKCRLRTVTAVLAGILIVYPLFSQILFSVSKLRLSVLFVPIGVIVAFLVFLQIRYIDLQKKRADDMQKMLFSMADSMAEAIEGRTPYNASHTKNVAKRCIEMLEHINKLHKEKKTKLRFTDKDKKQLYLAAMLHDIGKMDVPLEVMDKPTKLGANEERLRSRLDMIALRLENDALKGTISKEKADEKKNEISLFLSKLGLFNCGKPLGDEDKAFIDKMCSAVYISTDGEELPYITKEEADDLHIRAGTLSDEERSIMQSHVVYTDKILEHMQFGKDFSDVRAIAANHHELLNAKGYPNGIGADSLDPLTRILTIMDIYDSLIADDRPYKKAKPVKVAFDILDEEASAGKIDKELLEIAKDIWLE
ncbi:MAG: CHASE2 domain-containing protein, partial [Ruminiclostridium sp.]|nr:CHASE2 domain-containing protein [Ruminiclostridium sp.]